MGAVERTSRASMPECSRRTAATDTTASQAAADTEQESVWVATRRYFPSLVGAAFTTLLLSFVSMALAVWDWLAARHRKCCTDPGR